MIVKGHPFARFRRNLQAVAVPQPLNAMDRRRHDDHYPQNVPRGVLPTGVHRGGRWTVSPFRGPLLPIVQKGTIFTESLPVADGSQLIDNPPANYPRITFKEVRYGPTPVD
jgi:hypothetical protein